VLDLFTRWLDDDVRKSDPATSHHAAEDNRPRRMTQATRLLLAYADGWALSDEEAVKKAGLATAGSPWKRCSDLRKAGYIQPTGELVLTAHGSKAQVCIVTEKGVQEIRRIDPFLGLPQPARIGRGEV